MRPSLTGPTTATYRGREPGFPGPPAEIPACALTHRAPPLGIHDEPVARPRVTDCGFGPVDGGQEIDVLPLRAVPLGPTPEGTPEQPLAEVNEPLQVSSAPGDGIVVEPAVDDPAQPRSRFMPVVVPPLAKSFPDPPQGAVDPFPGRLASDPEPSLPRPVAEVRHAKEVKRLRLAQPPTPAVRLREPAELDEPGLVRVQFQSEQGQPLA